MPLRYSSLRPASKLRLPACIPALFLTVLLGATAVAADPSEDEPRAKSAQTTRSQATREESPRWAPVVRKAARHDTSRPLGDMKPLPPRPSEPRELPLRILPKALKSVHAPQMQDPVVQTAPGVGTMPAPLQTFEGQSRAEGGGLPPDANGDVGPNHYVQVINAILSVYDKSGTRLLGPIALNTIWSGFGGPCETGNNGIFGSRQPIVLYDHLADRWLVSQVALAGEGHHQCIAISQTGDPTGAWHRYDFLVRPEAFRSTFEYTNIGVAEFGVWPDAYYMAANQIVVADHAVDLRTYKRADGVGAFERDKMLQGLPARLVYFDLYAVDARFGNALPSDLDGVIHPPAGAPNIFMAVDDEADFGTDRLSLWEFHVDWVTPANSTFGINGNPNLVLDTAPFDWDMCGSALWCIPQPSPGEGLNALSDRLMYRLQYRNLGTHETLVSNHTVDADGADRAGVRWYELRNDGSGWTIYQQGTFAPADGLHRWMGSAALDASGNLAIGYSVSSSTVYPSIRYAGRLAGDPLNELTQGEAEMHTGTGSQMCRVTPFGCFHKGAWGKYSMMTVDPVDQCTFWYTQEYYPASHPVNFSTRIGSFTFAPACSPTATGTLTGTVTDNSTGLPLEGVHVQAGAASGFTAANGTYSILLAEGTYDVTASKFAYFPQTVIGVAIAGGLTTTQNFILDPMPLSTISGTVTDGSGHGWPLYARVNAAGAGTPDVFTNPLTGFYSVELPEGASFTLNVSAVSPGYNIESRDIVVPPGGQTEDFALTVNTAACTAPGYALVGGISESFESGIPPGWTVVTNGEADVMWSSESGFAIAPNNTGGAGWFAIVNSVFYGSFPESEDTELRTPSLDFSGHGTVFLEFDTDFFWWEGSLDEKGDVDVSTDGGATWTNVLRYQGGSVSGPHHETIDISALAGNQANVMVRFHYYDADWEYWWQVDNARVGAECLPAAGGLLVGNVFHATTGAGLNGATVTSDNAPADTTTTFPTTDDPAVDEGFYILFSSLTGAQPFTASKPGFESDTRTPIVVADAVVQQNFNLPVIPLLSVILTGTGSGTVTSDVPGIDCPPTCAEIYPEGTIVTLTAAAAPLSTFAGWGGDCTGVEPCTLTMDAARNVSANFIAASSTNSFFKGKVKDINTGAAIAGATVAASQGGVVLFTTTVSAEGKYKLAVTAGTWDLTASAPGYLDLTKTKTVGSNTTKKRIKFKLTPQ